MKIIGCDFHPGYQQIAMVDTETGEFTQMRLSHSNNGEEARKFYAGLAGPGRVGVEASGQSQWFERLLAGLGQGLWVGDAGEVRARRDRKHKNRRPGAGVIFQV